MIKDFILRILLFCVSLYYLFDYIVTCEVPTNIGIGVFAGSIILVAIAYYFMRGNNMTQCDCCKKSYVNNNV